LHRAARALVARGEQTFPARMEDARKLPGVGPYTGAAVLSIAYDQPHAPVDANIARVLSRLECLGRPDARGEPHAALAARLLDRRRPSDWNQALMELGEVICLPRTPLCDRCPIERACQARAQESVDRHPPPRPRRAVERLAIEITLVRDRAGRMLLERGAFAHLDHLWLPPIRTLTRPARARAFRHTILHRELDVSIQRRTLARRELIRLARGAAAPGVERRIVEAGALSQIGRSSLLTKALRHST
jgi:A/G-specific adenine glycosylase